MVKKLTATDWDEIQKSSPTSYYIQSVEDGELDVEFVTEIVVVERGDEDLVGNVWEKDWDKCEAKVIINGENKLYSMGGPTWNFMRKFVAECKKNSIRPEDVPGSIFRIRKELEMGNNGKEYENPFIKYIGKADGTKAGEELKLNEDKVAEIKDAIKDMKKNSADLIKDPLKTADFLKLLYIRCKMKPSESEKYLPKLAEDKFIDVDDDMIMVL